MTGKEISIAPMMGWTDKHFRYFARLISKKCFLYTEMITANAIEFGNYKNLLSFSKEEHPIALQIGGSNIDLMAQAANKAEIFKYDEININAGCPSEKVQNATMGACLMKKPDLIINIIKAMELETSIPITLKHRLGINNDNEYDSLKSFVEKIATKTKCEKFIVHARNAILDGISPKENRTIPPIKYDYVYKLKKDFPQLKIIINGEIKSKKDISKHFEKVDGVMIGRSAYKNSYSCISIFDQILHKGTKKIHLKSRIEIVEQYSKYVKIQLQKNVPLSHMAKHILTVFNGEKNSKLYRRHLSENMHSTNASVDVINDAMTYLEN